MLAFVKSHSVSPASIHRLHPSKRPPHSDSVLFSSSFYPLQRDYQPTFDIVVADFPSQSSLSLKADIKYKTNWQQGALKVQRKNRWICAMKDALKECMIWGPAGAGNPNPEPAAPAQYVRVKLFSPLVGGSG